MKYRIWSNGDSNGNGNGHSSSHVEGDFEFPGVLLETDPDVGASDGNNGKYHRPAARYDSGDWNVGWTDGRLGHSSDPTEKLILADAVAKRQGELRKARIEQATAQAKVLAFQNHLESLNERLKDLRTYYGILSQRRSLHSSESSLPLGLMYFVFGIFLFLADVPLSLTLVAEGFRIPIKYKIPELGRTVYISEIFSDPLLVLKHLWEAVLLALGIALIGIIVKFFVDAVVLRDDDDPPLSKRATVGLSLAFILFFVCTLCLGQFRAAVRAAQPNAQPVTYENLAFILLTLTFPIAGGLCFSAGWRRLERAKTYYLTSRRLARLEKQQRQVFSDFSGASESVKVLEETLGAGGDGLAISQAELKKNVYLHGYFRGRNVPETRDAGETLYSLCEKTLNRVLARKVRRNLQDI
jgi:hypothetical protein